MGVDVKQRAACIELTCFVSTLYFVLCSPNMSVLTPAIWTNVTRRYDEFMAHGDERIVRYPMMQSPGPTLSLCFAYLVFVKVIGPKLMANRKPMELRVPMIIYNFAMVLLNGYMFIMFGVHGWFGKYGKKL